MKRHRIGTIALWQTCLACATFLVAATASAQIIVVPAARGMVDHAAPGDFDGDGVADLGVKHDTGSWTYDLSADGFHGSLATVTNHQVGFHVPARREPVRHRLRPRVVGGDREHDVAPGARPRVALVVAARG
jgi:hypothetical protein